MPMICLMKASLFSAQIDPYLASPDVAELILETLVKVLDKYMRKVK